MSLVGLVAVVECVCVRVCVCVCVRVGVLVAGACLRVCVFVRGGVFVAVVGGGVVADGDVYVSVGGWGGGSRGGCGAHSSERTRVWPIPRCCCLQHGSVAVAKVTDSLRSCKKQIKKL